MSFRPEWYGRQIGRNHACMRPSRFVFVDVETKRVDVKGKEPYIRHELLRGSACYVSWKKGRKPKEQWLEFSTNQEFWGWLRQWESGKCVVWCVSNNAIFAFTILGLWDKIETKRYAVDRAPRSYCDPRTGKQVVSKQWRGLLAIDSRPFHVETQGETGRVNFTDLGNYYSSTIEEIERMVDNGGAENQKGTASNKDVKPDCRRRCDIIRGAYLGLVGKWQSEDNGNWKLSAAGLAWSNYRHKHYNTPIIAHKHAEARGLEWKSYFGGECRCYYRGTVQTGVQHYDVNSLYPYVMATNDFPTELVDYILCPSPGIVEHLLSRFAVIADVTMETHNANYPTRHNNRTVYPLGRFRTQLTGPELCAAWSEGAVKQTHSIAYYLRGNLFGVYVEHWYRAKRSCSYNNDKAGERFCKLMLNSLQGKFAQRTPMWETEKDIDVTRPWKCFPWTDPKTGYMYNARSIAWLGQKLVSKVDKQHTFPAISAYITAYARDYMRRCRKNIPPSLLYYQDTDSLHVDASESERCGDFGLPIGAGLGDFRRVATYKEVTYRGPKNYTNDCGNVIAGIKASDIRIGKEHFVGQRIERASAVVNREPDCTVREYTKHFDCPGGIAEGGYSDSGWSRPLILSQI